MSILNLLAGLLRVRPRAHKPPRATAHKARLHRLFFALCPDEPVRQALVAAQDLFPRQLSENWIRPGNLHISLAVLEGAGAEWLDDIKRAGAATQAAAFELSLDRITYWPDRRILCLTPSVVPDPLERLAANLAGSLDAAGFDMTRYPYRPYLTLARYATYPPPDIRLASPVVWKAASFALLKSRPEGLDVAHDVVASWPLQDAQAGVAPPE